MLYQKRLNEIVEFYTYEHIYPDTVIRAISELHRIEVSMFNFLKDLPAFNMEIKREVQCFKCRRRFKDDIMLGIHECSGPLPEPVV